MLKGFLLFRRNPFILALLLFYRVSPSKLTARGCTSQANRSWRTQPPPAQSYAGKDIREQGLANLRFDKIIVLEDGHVTEMGTHEELLANRGYYSEVVERHVEDVAELKG